ncbi:MAG TPA: hypothetical protein VEP49_03925 [Acidimicrobiia bacterium]|nr:hypothetical protein [Acidimicrobiia bacterium]
MSLFRRHPEVRGGPTGVPGLPELAASLGLQPAAPEHPFDGHLEDQVHQASRIMYGEPHSVTTFSHVVVGGTTYSDVYRGTVDGHTVIVANAWTEIESDPRVYIGLKGSAVCAVELPTMLPIAGIEPRGKFEVLRVVEAPTGNPDFDARYRVGAMSVGTLDVVTPAVQQRVMVRDDWVFLAERYLLGCVSLPDFRTADEVSQRVRDVLAVVAAFPASVVPTTVDHSFDDLLGRVSQLHSVEDALAFLQQLTPDDRERLARSDTPLAAFADVQTPDEAMARLRTLDEQQKLQLFAMFSKAKDERGRS